MALFMIKKLWMKIKFSESLMKILRWSRSEIIINYNGKAVWRCQVNVAILRILGHIVTVKTSVGVSSLEQTILREAALVTTRPIPYLHQTFDGSHYPKFAECEKQLDMIHFRF